MEGIEMKRRLNFIMRRFRYWMMPKKDCNSCCLSCPYYKECVGDYVRIRIISNK